MRISDWSSDVCSSDLGLPDVRMVLMKEYDARGFVFYTNFESQKGRELLANMPAAAVFHWQSLRRPVRIRGAVTIASDSEADAYFASRPTDRDRKSAVEGKWVSVRVTPVGRRPPTKQRQQQRQQPH